LLRKTNSFWHRATVGVVRRRDVLRLLIRGQTNDAGESSA